MGANGGKPKMLRSSSFSVFSTSSPCSERPGCSLSTRHRRARGRPFIGQKAQGQQYLTPCEETAVVKFLLHMENLGQPMRIKYIPSLAYRATRQWPIAKGPAKLPGKNWAQTFQKRHPALKARRLKALDWIRCNIYDKVVHWFEIIGRELSRPDVLPQNVYNMDETGVMLSMLNSVKVLVSKDEQRDYRGARVKRTTVTAIECISADGRSLKPMIIWPAKTHRDNWTTFPTPGWRYALSESGYTDSRINLEWLKRVFDPQTKEQAGSKPRLLIWDSFSTHETLEVLEFCLENNIVLCRLPPHTSHVLQPCDVAVFGPLKAAYRDRVERLEFGGVGVVSKEHFTYLYSPARELAITARNIGAGFRASGLYPFNSERVLADLPKTFSLPAVLESDGVQIADTSQVAIRPPRTSMTPTTPATPVTAQALSSLQTIIEQDADALDDTEKDRMKKYVQKLVKAAGVSFAERDLHQDHARFLLDMNNESKVRRPTRSTVLGNAKVMSYEDLEEARAKRAAKELAKGRGGHKDRGEGEGEGKGKGRGEDESRGQDVYTECADLGDGVRITEFRAPVARMR